MAKQRKGSPPGISRRSVLKGLGGGVLTTGLISVAELPRQQTNVRRENGVEVYGPDAVPLTLKINGREHHLQLEPRVTLLNALRNHLDLTGPKLVCDRGTCGGCTVLLDGMPITSCMMLAIDAVGHEIQTIEGLAQGEMLHPVQQAFIERDALQCGFCTSGMIMSAKALLDRNPNPTLDEVKAAVSGNLCRCGTYPKVFEAVLAAAKSSGRARKGG
ncbi:MAG: (2Fe-2S)-binding protein [Acidobacteria bacterium]|nr:(2Fe-2S)-binding protein [Acidobacteriota bacterium]